jgi:hypothetical protein
MREIILAALIVVGLGADIVTAQSFAHEMPPASDQRVI